MARWVAEETIEEIEVQVRGDAAGAAQEGDGRGQASALAGRPQADALHI